jgi:pilus assembly protein Flp/PilA
MFKLLRKFRRNQSGATAIEYGLIVALIAVASIAALTTGGTRFQGVINAANTGMAQQ